MGEKFGKKGVSNAIWVIIALIVALAVALVLIVMFGGTADKTKKQTGDAIDTSGGAVSAQICSGLCDDCKKLYGDDCADRWVAIGKNCDILCQ